MGPTQNTQWYENASATKAGPRARAGLRLPRYADSAVIYAKPMLTLDDRESDVLKLSF